MRMGDGMGFGAGARGTAGGRVAVVLAAIMAGAAPAMAETWQARLDALAAGAPIDPAFDLLQLAQETAPDGVVRFDIPAQPLSGALMAFGAQSGLQVTVDSRIVAGLSSPGISGDMTPETALQQLLSGSGISWRFIGTDTVALEKTQTNGDITLDPLRVQGQGETASSPVDGYVATRSATGSKSDTPIIETPQSISVITADEMDAQAAGSLAEALRYTPGVTAELFGIDQRGFGIQIRGFDADESSFYRDGLQMRGTSFSAFLPLDTYGAERLEVLRGPASVLYGQNSPGGVINYVSKRPTKEPQHEVELGGGTFDRVEGKFDLSGPINEEGSLLYRVTGLARNSDTQVDFVNDDRYFIAPALTWEGEDTTLTLLAHYQYDNAGWGIQFLPAAGTVRDNPNGRIPRHTFVGEPDFDRYVLDQFSIGYLLEHRFDDVFTVRQNARFSYLDNKADLVYGFGLIDDRTLFRIGDEGRSELGAVAVDNQLQAKFDTGPVAHTALFGVDFQRYDFSDFGAEYEVDPIDIYDPDYGAELTNKSIYEDSETDQRQIGLYFQEQAKFFDKLVILLGGRYDFARSEIESNLDDSTTTSKDEAFTGRAGLVYLFDNGLAPYFSYSESFEPVLESDAEGKPFKPEKGRQYEVGVKYQPPGTDSFVTLSIFDLVKQNVLTADPADPFGNSVQTGEIRSRGIELEGVASFDSGLDVRAAYTFLDAEITKSNVLDDDGEGEDGQQPGRTARHTASLWADYTIPQGDFTGLGFGGGVRYIGSSFGDNFEDLNVSGYVLTDAAIHYEWNDFRFALNGSNIFDKAYVASCFGETQCFYGERRAVIGTVTFKW
jgi:iron complex outermembrane recepter protein